MTQFSVPLAVIQDIARAKNLIKRNEIVRGIDALLNALESFSATRTIGKSRFVVEVNLRECVAELNANLTVRTFLQSLSHSRNVKITYTPGEEKRLMGVLSILGKALAGAATAEFEAAEEAVKSRKEQLLVKAGELLKAGEGPRAKSVLRKISEEFGHEKGVLATIGEMLIQANFEFDAIEFFAAAIGKFPRDPGPYVALAKCYLKFREYEKAEKLYMQAIRVFGIHPKTLVNLGKVYIAWNKKDKAFEVLNQVVRKYPDDKEARELLELVDK